MAGLALVADPFSTEGRAPGGAERTFLVVEADRRTAEELCAAVRELGFAAEWSQDAQDALQAIAAGGIAGVLLDVDDRRAGGQALIRHLHREGPGVHLVGVGEEPGGVDLIRMVRRGVVDFIVRPVRSTELSEVLDRLVERLEREEEAAAKAAAGTAAELDGVRGPVAMLVDELNRGEVALPSLSTLGERVQELMSMPTCGVNEVLEVVSADPAVTSRVLQEANSPTYAGRGEARSAREACMRLGNDESLRLAREVILGDMFRMDGTPLEDIARDTWRNVLVTARGAKELSDLLAIGDPERTYTLGLLHNAGELVFLRLASQLKPDQRGPAATLRLLQAPMDELHETIGARVLETWRMPAELVQVAGAHHDPSKLPTEDLRLQATIVLLAWTWAIRTGHDCAHGGAAPDAQPLLLELGVSEAEMDELFAHADAWLAQAGGA